MVRTLEGWLSFNLVVVGVLGFVNYGKKILVSIVAWQRALEVNIDSLK